MAAKNEDLDDFDDDWEAQPGQKNPLLRQQFQPRPQTSGMPGMRPLGGGLGSKKPMHHQQNDDDLDDVLDGMGFGG